MKLSLTTTALALAPVAWGAEFSAKRKRNGAPAASREFALTALGRMSMGCTPEDLARLGQFKLVSHVEEQLHPDTLLDSECDRRLIGAQLPTLSKFLKELWTDHRLAADAIRDAQKASPTPSGSPLPKGAPPVESLAGAFKGGGSAQIPHPEGSPAVKMADENKLRQQPAKEVEIATWIRAVYSQRQLQEVLANFWHDHFSVFAWDNAISPVWVHYDRDVIRKHLLGNFREMLEAVAKSPAMLFYLDNFVNQSGNPNENYARELFELHTLGAENYLGTRARRSVPGYAAGDPVGYVDGDVYEAARCFTGWRVDANQKEGANSGEFGYYEPWHDRFQKIVLGRSLGEYGPPMKDGNDVLDILAAHPGTARFVSRKLCRKFIADIPPEALVHRVAKLFHEQRKAPDQLKQVTRAILLSDEFRQMRRAKLKRPFEATAGMLRAVAADFHPTEPFLGNYQRAGQRLFAWRSPDGYPDSHIRWGGTTPMLERWRMANLICAGKVEGVKVDIKRLTQDHERDPEEMSRFWSERLLGQPLAEPSRKAIEEFLKTDTFNDERHHLALALILMSPEFQWR